MLLFITFYFALAGWFLYTPWRIVVDGAGSDLGFIAWIMAACSLFLGVFMVKALFSVKNATPEGIHEITRKDQPDLFNYLFKLADAAGAPRPHRVYLSGRVNAAVFYDLSLFNLIFPSKKNLEIGLALVNTLSLGEFRAVLAHEFGHFAQRSMAVGRWVYVARQIAAHLVNRRDALDDFLVTVGNLDLRVRAVVAVVQLVVWAIRSLIETLFTLVSMVEHSLSREMEMQADLVAVSLTGSDALIHALHKLSGADDAWERALNFIYAERDSGRATRDVFAVHTHMLARMSAILNDEAYVKVPPLPEQDAAGHRIFKAGLAQPPRMWLTHPLNHEREANAKRLYVKAAIDPASAWSVFTEAALLRHEMTNRLLGEHTAPGVEIEESLTALGRQFKREQYNRRYCGIYFGRPLARHVSRHDELRNPARPSTTAEMATLYPATLTEDLQLLRSLEGEAGQLEALIAGMMTMQNGVVRLRGVDYRRKELPAALARVKDEIAAVEGRLHAHDFLCRSWHQSMALEVGGNWQQYMDGLLALIHYAEHTVADIEDLSGMLRNRLAVETALRTVNAEGVSRIVMQANDLHHAMEMVYKAAPRLVLDEKLVARLETPDNWSGMLGGFGLLLAQNDNINEWLNIVDSWVRSLTGCLNAVRSAALEELLLTETKVARQARQPGAMEPAPAPSVVPASFPILLPGAERKRQTTLNWWGRFQRADGWLPGGARLLAAGAIVAGVLGASSFNAGHGTSMFGDAPSLQVYNGLGLKVTVTVDGVTRTLAPGTAAPLPLPVFGQHRVEARAPDGRLIESFQAQAKPGGHPVYNIAGAALLGESSAVYGGGEPPSPRLLGAPRWIDSTADHIFSEPPKELKMRRGERQTRTMLDGLSTLMPEYQVQMVTPEEALRIGRLHVKWDDSSHAHYPTWLAFLGMEPGRDTELVAERLKASPNDVVLRRVEYDNTPVAGQPALCAETTRRSDAAPDDADLLYLALRCQGSAPGVSDRILAASKRWPANNWLMHSAAYQHVFRRDYSAALAAFEQVVERAPAMADPAALQIARIRRWREESPDLTALEGKSPYLDMLVRMETRLKTDVADPGLDAYRLLGQGKLAQAVAAAPEAEGMRARVLRLAAVSAGATEDMRRDALALPLESGASAPALWATLGLKMKASGDLGQLNEATRRVTGSSHRHIMAFLGHLKKGGRPEQADLLLTNVDLEERAHAYIAGVALMGEKAPGEWKNLVRKVLFEAERPYFG